MKKYYTYLARCKDDTIYTGYALNLKNREAKHNAGEGAKYTRGRLPLKIVYSESFNTITEAMRREMEIKRWSRKRKKN